MRRCTECEEEKPEEEFYWRIKGKQRSYRCKLCDAAAAKQWYQENKELCKKRALGRIAEAQKNMLEYLNGKSCGCGENRVPCLEFDHRDPSQKCHGISFMVKGGFKWEKILAEIKKCDLVCANCHRMRTAEQQGWYNRIS